MKDTAYKKDCLNNGDNKTRQISEPAGVNGTLYVKGVFMALCCHQVVLMLCRSHVLVVSRPLCRQRRTVDLRDLLAASVEAAAQGGLEVKTFIFTTH